jgi:hypothetical protein
MTDKEQNRSEVNQEPISKDITGMNSRGKDRRRFIKRAIVAAPFILTVASRPVWAANCTLSGQLSGNLSDAGDPCGGEGCSADYWVDHTDMWHYEFQPGCVFDSVFGTNVFGTDTLGDVISKNGENGVKRLGREAVAALQNSATRVSFEYMVCDLIYDVRKEFETGDNQSNKSFAESLQGLNDRVCPFT